MGHTVDAMRWESEFYHVNGSKLYFSPSDALAAGFTTLPFYELSPAVVLPIAETAFDLEISELKEVTLSACDVLPTWKGLRGDISQLPGVTSTSFLSAVEAGEYGTAVFESDGLFIAILGTDETWIVHARPQGEEILAHFQDLLGYSKRNAELLGRSATFAPYFAGTT